MKKELSLYLYGTIVIIVGAFLLIANHYSFVGIKSIIGVSVLTGAFFALLTAIGRQRRQVEFAYHEMHAIAMFIYGFYVLFFCTSTQSLINATLFLFMLYTFAEIAFCIWIYNLGQKVKFRIVLLRITLGLFTGLGSVGVLYIELENNLLALQGLGAIFIILGLNILLYVPIMKGREKPMTVYKFIRGK